VLDKHEQRAACGTTYSRMLCPQPSSRKEGHYVVLAKCGLVAKTERNKNVGKFRSPDRVLTDTVTRQFPQHWTQFSKGKLEDPWNEVPLTETPLLESIRLAAWSVIAVIIIHQSQRAACCRISHADCWHRGLCMVRSLATITTMMTTDNIIIPPSVYHSSCFCPYSQRNISGTAGSC
jgi:hypothetical protein